MAIPSTTTVDLLFVSREPAWENGVELIQSMVSGVFTSRSGLEQRQQRIGRGHWTMRYRTYDVAATALSRWKRTQAELAAPLVVPFWPEGGTLASLASDVATISRTATEDWFLVGDYIFITNGTVGQFRTIAGYGISLQALELEEVDDPVAFSPGARVYPCRLCERGGGKAEAMILHEASRQEEVTYNTL
jgi:hypothetical protein